MSALRRIRLDADPPLSIADLAEQSGVSDDQIRNIENGDTRRPRAITLRKLADALNVQPSDLDPVLTDPDRRTAAA